MLAAADTAHSKLAVGPSPRWRDAPGVEHDRGPALPRLLLAAHHQLADPRGRPPVHPAQVVAAPVLPGRGVVLAVHGDRAGPAVAGARVLAGQPDRRQRHDLRDHGELVDAGERAGQLAQPERVGQPDDQRADLVPAAHVGPHRVGHRAGLLGAEPFQHDPRAGCPARTAAGPPAAACRWAAGTGSAAAAPPGRWRRPAPGAARATRVQASLYRLRPTYAAASSGSDGQQHGDPQQVPLAEDQRGESGGGRRPRGTSDRAWSARAAPRARQRLRCS